MRWANFWLTACFPIWFSKTNASMWWNGVTANPSAFIHLLFYSSFFLWSSVSVVNRTFLMFLIYVFLHVMSLRKRSRRICERSGLDGRLSLHHNHSMKSSQFLSLVHNCHVTETIQNFSYVFVALYFETFNNIYSTENWKLSLSLGDSVRHFLLGVGCFKSLSCRYY